MKKKNDAYVSEIQRAETLSELRASARRDGWSRMFGNCLILVDEQGNVVRAFAHPARRRGRLLVRVRPYSEEAMAEYCNLMAQRGILWITHFPRPTRMREVRERLDILNRPYIEDDADWAEPIEYAPVPVEYVPVPGEYTVWGDPPPSETQTRIRQTADEVRNRLEQEQGDRYRRFVEWAEQQQRRIRDGSLDE